MPVEGVSIGRPCRLVSHRADRAVVGGRERHYTWVGEGLIGELLDEGDVGAFGELVAPGPQDGAPIEACSPVG